MTASYITLFASPQFPASKMFSLNDPSKLFVFSESKPLTLSNCTKAKFCLYYSAPVMTLM